MAADGSRFSTSWTSSAREENPFACPCGLSPARPLRQPERDHRDSGGHSELQQDLRVDGSLGDNLAIGAKNNLDPRPRSGILLDRAYADPDPALLLDDPD